MFLAFTASALLAGVFAHLGALSVKVSVLTVALQCSVVVALLATLTAIWSVFMINRR
jgi:hypothetical protein